METIAALGIIKKARAGMGHGLFASRDIKKGECVAEYTGKRLTTAEADKSRSRYLFEIDKDWTIDGSPRSNIARYINHSCDPNCESDIKKGRIFITALRAIKKGEELSFDYGKEYFDEFIKPKKCQCDSCLKRSR